MLFKQFPVLQIFNKISLKLVYIKENGSLRQPI